MSFIAEFSFWFCCFVFDVKQLLKYKCVVYYVMTKMGANKPIRCIIVNILSTLCVYYVTFSNVKALFPLFSASSIRACPITSHKITKTKNTTSLKYMKQ